MTKNIPNGHKMYQIDIKDPNDLKIYQTVPFQGPKNIFKLGFRL
jgi:hypothetical protein